MTWTVVAFRSVPSRPSARLFLSRARARELSIICLSYGIYCWRSNKTLLDNCRADKWSLRWEKPVCWNLCWQCFSLLFCPTASGLSRACVEERTAKWMTHKSKIVQGERITRSSTPQRSSLIKKLFTLERLGSCPDKLVWLSGYVAINWLKI